MVLSAACACCAPPKTVPPNDVDARRESASAQPSGAPIPADRDADVTVEGGDWTAGIRERAPSAGGVALLRNIRAAKHAGLDRVVFEFEGALPGYHVEYIDRPVRRCASGQVTQIEGDAWLEVRFERAQAHDEDGRASIVAREQRPGLPIVRELELTCDFEAVVSAVVGVSRPNRYRLMTLSAPSRLVVDIRHAR
jgi:hypothetical protein